MKGYIYIRYNEYWNIYNACKLGKTLNIYDREQTYITSEIKRGYYKLVIELDYNILDYIEKILQNHFNILNLHVKINGGIEFYKKEIIEYILSYLDNYNIIYRILNENEIFNFLSKKDKKLNLLENNNIIIKSKYIPRDYQNEIIQKSYEYLKNNDKGLLIMPCGIGKTLISLWISSEILNKMLLKKSILIGVPNKLLLQQWYEIILELFPNIKKLKVYNGIKIIDIINFLKNNNECIIITTYISSYKIYKATFKLKFKFSIKILDEIHHLTGPEERYNEKKYIKILEVFSIKQLSLTATPKDLNTYILNSSAIISNNNNKYFGEIIDRKCLLWGIENNIICDYEIQTIILDEDIFNNEINYNIIDDNKKLFFSAFMSLKSIYDNFSDHILIYSNSKKNLLELEKYIKLLNNKFFNISDLYYSQYYGEMKLNTKNKIIENFNKSKFGIIICVYCLGEGYDNNNINAVVFAENMTSNIRIVQSSLRACRKNSNQPNKISKIILPIINKNNWLDNENDINFKNVREIIYQMALEDTTISQKIKVFNINIKNYKEKKVRSNILIEYNNELTEKLKLKTIKRAALGITYEEARRIILEKEIKTKESYNKLCDKDYRLSKEPEIIFKKEFTNWIEYFSIKRIYYDLETCKEKVKEYLLSNPKIKNNDLNLSKICNKLCNIDKLFPPNGLWIEYYNIKNLEDIIIINNKKKKSDII